MTITENETTILNKEDIEPGCDFGHNVWHGMSNVDPCERKADWFMVAHDCYDGPDGTPGFICDQHYQLLVGELEFLKYMSAICEGCRKIFTDISQLIWAVRKL